MPMKLFRILILVVFAGILAAEVHALNPSSLKPLLGALENDVTNTFAFPNPFKPSKGHTTIKFAFLPNSGSIRIYSAAGELVEKITFTDLGDKFLSWNVTNSSGEKVGSGVYIYIVESGKKRKTGKLVIVR